MFLLIFLDSGIVVLLLLFVVSDPPMKMVIILLVFFLTRALKIRLELVKGEICNLQLIKLETELLNNDPFIKMLLNDEFFR